MFVTCAKFIKSGCVHKKKHLKIVKLVVVGRHGYECISFVTILVLIHCIFKSERQNS